MKSFIMALFGPAICGGLLSAAVGVGPSPPGQAPPPRPEVGQAKVSYYYVVLYERITSPAGVNRTSKKQEIGPFAHFADAKKTAEALGAQSSPKKVNGWTYSYYTDVVSH